MSDDEMKPEAWRLLQVVREADSPSELDMRRVRRAIAASVGTALAAPAAAKAASAATSKGLAAATASKGAALMTAVKGVAALAVLASLGAGAVWWSHQRSHESVAPARMPARAPESSPGTREPVAALGEAAAPSTLMAELTLLQRAQRALAGGAPSEALALAGEHATRYPRSQLAGERDAVRVFAECALGQRADARALAIEILKSAPRSPLRTSLEQSCAAPLPAR